MDDITYDLASEMIIDTITEFEPRVNIDNITFVEDFDNNVLLINVYCTVKSTNDTLQVQIPYTL